MEIQELTDKNYRSIVNNEDRNIFIDFYSPMCGPCQILDSMLPTIAEYALNKNTIVVKCDISKNKKIREYYNVQATPLTLIVNTKKEIKEPLAGAVDISKYLKNIDSVFNPKKSFFSRFFS